MNNDLLTTAKELARQGVSVIGANVHANKKPVTNHHKNAWNKFQEHIATEDELKVIFSKSTANSIATIGGRVSGGLEIIDFDKHHPHAGIEGRFFGNVYPAWAELINEKRPDLFQQLVINSTPNDGNHVRYRYKAEIYEGKKNLAQAYNQDADGKIMLRDGNPEIVTIIEQRGERSYALCPPSPNYEMVQGSLLEIPVITKEERDFLIHTAKSFHVISLEKQHSKPPTDELRPGDDFNQRGEHRGLLEKHGWTFVTARRDGAELWRRPGKDDNGWSATWDAIPNRFYVFSTNASPLEAERTYDCFALCAFLEHRGDFGAATRALAREGYGKRPSVKVSMEAGNDIEPIPDEVLNAAAEFYAPNPQIVTSSRNAGDDSEPIPDKVLDAMTPIAYVTEPLDETLLDTTPPVSIPELPESVWRGAFADYRELMAPTSEASDSYHFAAFLTTVGALLGRCVMIHYAGPLYPNFYVVVEGRTGISRKSSAARAAVETIRDVDSTLILRRGLSTMEGLINLLRAPTKEEIDEYAEGVDAFKEGRITQEPTEPSPIFPHEGRRLLVTLDEFALLLKKAKQESSSTLIQGLTDAYDCPPTLDNPTKERPMSAYKPCVSLIGLTTKAWLERTLDYDDLLGGFVNRFIFFAGEPKSPIPLPPTPASPLWNKIKAHLNTVRISYHNAPVCFKLSPDAVLLWDAYYRSWHTRQKECDNEMLACLIQRLPNHAMKSTLVFGALEDKHGSGEINAEQLAAGIDFANYAEKSYEYLFRGFGFSKRSRVETTIVEKLSRQRRVRRSKRTISNDLNSHNLKTGKRENAKTGQEAVSTA